MNYKILMVQLSHGHTFQDDSLLPLHEYSYLPQDYPLGLGYLSNSLKQNGYKARFIDLWGHPEEISTLFSGVDNFDAIGISFYVTQYKQLSTIVTRIKNHNKKIPIIVGGPGAKPSYKILLTQLPIDFVVFEEAEISLTNLLREIFSNRNYKDVKGIAFKDDNGSIKTTDEQQYIRDLNTLDFPDRECLDFSLYSKDSPLPGMKGFKETNVITGRGCPYRCTFCSKTFSGSRQRSVENVINEIKYLKEKYGIQCIKFNDELVITSKKRVYELCERIKALDVRWGCQGRVNLMDEEMLKWMKESGCVYIGYGFENATQKILDAMKKKIDAEKLVKVYKMTKNAGITPLVQYMYGFIGENEDSLQNTIQFFKDINLPAMGFNVQPIPGTELYEHCIKKGFIQDEIKYLEEFCYGYNKGECVINLSEFPDVETLNKKIWDTKRIININYYKRHPVKSLLKIKNSIILNKHAFFSKIYKFLLDRSPRVYKKT